MEKILSKFFGLFIITMWLVGVVFLVTGEFDKALLAWSFPVGVGLSTSIFVTKGGCICV